MARRLLMAAGSVLLVLLGAGLVAGSLALWTAFGWSSRVSQDLGTIQVQAPARAVVIDIAEVGATSDWPLVGDLSLQASDGQGVDLSMVAGEAAEADRYLEQVAYAAATLGPSGWTLAQVPGGPVPTPPPTGTWRTEASGAEPVITVQAPESVVIHRLDWSPPASLDLRLVWQITDPTRAILVLGIVGSITVLAGLALAWGAATLRWTAHE